MFARLKRLFSPAYRRGLAAEARGDLVEAAHAFARAGLPAERFRVQAAIARAETDPRARRIQQAEALAAATEAGVDDAALNAPRCDLARTLIEVGDTQARQEAASLLAAAGRLEQAADLLLEAQDFDGARRLLEAGRLFERLEAIDRAEAERRTGAARTEDALAEASEHLAGGRRREAEEQLVALTRAPFANEATRNRAQEALALLQAARISGRIRLRAEDGRTVILAAGLPVVLGRTEESPLPLGDAGVSRRHARLLREGSAVALEDLGSRNGTLVDGVPLAARFTFQGPARFSLGDTVRLRYSPGPPLCLEIERGLAAGTRCAILREGDTVAIDALFDGPGTGDSASLELERGRYRLRFGAGFCLSGAPPTAGERIELAEGDLLEWPSLRLKVARG